MNFLNFKYIRNTLGIISALIILFSYQNCAPVGDASGDGSTQGGNTPIPPTGGVDDDPDLDVCLGSTPMSFNSGGSNSVFSNSNVVSFDNGQESDLSGLGDNINLNLKINKGLKNNLVTASKLITVNIINNPSSALDVRSRNVNSGNGTAQIQISQADDGSCIAEGPQTVVVGIKGACSAQFQVSFKLASINTCKAEGFAKFTTTKNKEASIVKFGKLGTKLFALSASTKKIRIFTSSDSSNDPDSFTEINTLDTSSQMKDISAISLSSTHLAVGGIDTDDLGKVLIYSLSEIVTDKTKAIKETFSPAAAFEVFGTELAFANDYLAVSANNANGATFAQGAVYLYDFNSGIPTTHFKIIKRGVTGNRFGFALAADSSNNLLIANNKDTVFKYNLSNGNDSAFSFSGPAGSAFGSSISISSGKVAIGAPKKGSPNPGAVYIYDILSSTVIGSLNGDDLESFGASVVLSGDKLYVSAPGEGASGLPGRVYKYSRSSITSNNMNNNTASWRYLPNPIAGHDQGNYRFGNSLSVPPDSTNLIAIGQPGYSNDNGAFYIQEEN